MVSLKLVDLVVLNYPLNWNFKGELMGYLPVNGGEGHKRIPSEAHRQHKEEVVRVISQNFTNKHLVVMQDEYENTEYYLYTNFMFFNHAI